MSVGKCAALALSRMAASAVFCSFGRQAAQHVVGAELDDQRVRVRRDRPIVAREPVLRGVARDARVDDLHVPTPGAQRRLELVGKRLSRRHAVPGGEAVAKDDEAQRARRGALADAQSQNGGESQRLDEGAPMPI